MPCLEKGLEYTIICHKVEVKSTHDKSGPCFNTCREDPWGKTSPTELDPILLGLFHDITSVFPDDLP